MKPLMSKKIILPDYGPSNFHRIETNSFKVYFIFQADKWFHYGQSVSKFYRAAAKNNLPPESSAMAKVVD